MAISSVSMTQPPTARSHDESDVLVVTNASPVPPPLLDVLPARPLPLDKMPPIPRDWGGIILLVAPSCASASAAAAIDRIRAIHRAHSAVLVTSGEPDNASKAVRIWSGEVLWIDTAADELPDLLRRLRKRDIRRRMRDLFQSALYDEDPKLARCLDAVFLGEEALCRHADLAEEAGISEPTLRSVWTAAGFTGRSEALLDWGLLAHAIHLRTRGTRSTDPRSG